MKFASYDLNIVALHIPKGWRNGENKPNLREENHIMSTRQPKNKLTIESRVEICIIKKTLFFLKKYNTLVDINLTIII